MKNRQVVKKDFLWASGWESLQCAARVTDDGRVVGWAVSQDAKDAQVVVEIGSGSDVVYLVADLFRQNLLDGGIHLTGYCGFSWNISEWANQDIEVRAVGVYQNDVSLKTVANDNDEFVSEQPSPIFFVHIPKTAGTSFRTSVENYFGADAIVKNYGPGSVETSPLAAEYLLNKRDCFGFYQRLLDSRARLYSGHVHACPMAHVFPLNQIVSFIRNPVEQVVSHYNHYMRWNDYSGTFEEFVEQPKFRNLQSRLLSSLPISLVGFIGITEELDDGLRLFNSEFGVDCESEKLNVNDKKTVQHIDDASTCLIEKQNQQDIQLYNYVTTLFRQRLEQLKAGKPWCYGAIHKRDSTIISGYACWRDNSEPVQVVLLSGGNEVAETKAVEYRAVLANFVVPRAGFIGFHFDITKLENSQNLQVMVKSTGQLLTTTI